MGMALVTFRVEKAKAGLMKVATTSKTGMYTSTPTRQPGATNLNAYHRMATKTTTNSGIKARKYSRKYRAMKLQVRGRNSLERTGCPSKARQKEWGAVVRGQRKQTAGGKDQGDDGQEGDVSRGDQRCPDVVSESIGNRRVVRHLNPR
jgi:hypothetical protein